MPASHRLAAPAADQETSEPKLGASRPLLGSLALVRFLGLVELPLHLVPHSARDDRLVRRLLGLDEVLAAPLASRHHPPLVPGDLAELAVDELDEAAAAPLVPGREPDVGRVAEHVLDLRLVPDVTEDGIDPEVVEPRRYRPLRDGLAGVGL